MENWTVYLVHVVLAVVQFLVINWIGGHSTHAGYYQISFVQSVEDAPLFNAVFRILAPQIFLILAATALFVLRLDYLVSSFWLVTVWYVSVRWGFNLLMGRIGLLNWPRQIIIAFFAVSISKVLSTELLASRERLLPSIDALRDQLWILVIGFLYVTANRVDWPSLGKTPEERKTRYLLRRFQRSRARFHEIVSGEAEVLAVEVLSYSVLLYESFNRPPFVQALERYILFPSGFASSLGPMQVQTPVSVADELLVKEGVSRLRKGVEAALEEMYKAEYADQQPDGESNVSISSFASAPTYIQWQALRLAASRYNVRSDYADQVLGIAQVLIDGPYKDEWALTYPDESDGQLG